MCRQFTTTPQSHRGIKSLHLGCGCGCLGVRRFLTIEEKIEMLENYKKQLQKELTGVEETIKEIKGEIK